MLFTWDTENLCIVFRSWRVHSTASLIGSIIGVILLTAGYELVRELARRYEARSRARIEALHRKFRAHAPAPLDEPRSSIPFPTSLPCFQALLEPSLADTVC